MTWWHATITFTTSVELSDELIDELVEAFAPHSGALSIRRDLHGGAATFSLQASSTLTAARTAADVFTETIQGLNLGEVVTTKLEVMTEAEMEESLSEPVYPQVVGYAEIAEMAGVSRQRARQFARIAGFPRPVIETSQGPLMSRHAVTSWLETRNTTHGRPRKELATAN